MKKTKFCWHCGKKMRGNSQGIIKEIYNIPRLFHKQCSKDSVLKQYDEYKELFGW